MGVFNHFRKLGKYTRLTLLVLAAGIIIRFILAAMHHPAGDACWDLSAARFMAENFRIPVFEPLGRDVFTRMPLFHFIAAFLYNIFSVLGNNAAELGMKMVSPVMGSLSLWFTFLIAKKIRDERTAFYAVLFLAFVPMHIYQSSLSYLDMTMALFATLSVYLILENRLVLSGIAAGLAMLSKFNGIFILPVILFIIIQNSKKDWRKILNKSLIFILLALAIAMPWYIRNWTAVGNPFWPFLGGIFRGNLELAIPYSGMHPGNLLSVWTILSTTYLGIYGIPSGRISSVSSLGIPNFTLLFSLWLVATIIFTLPFIISFFRKSFRKQKTENSFLYVWILSYIAFYLLFVIHAEQGKAFMVTFSRYLLPCFTAVAILWADGINIIINKIRSRSILRVLALALALIMIMFVSAEFAKTAVAANNWKAYESDFEWIKNNIKDSDIIVNANECLTYNTNKHTLLIGNPFFDQATHVWHNSKGIMSAYSLKVTLQDLEQDKNKYNLVYSNEKTGTRVYEIR